MITVVVLDETRKTDNGLRRVPLLLLELREDGGFGSKMENKGGVGRIDISSEFSTWYYVASGIRFLISTALIWREFCLYDVIGV
jgi:hypothetical protein